MRLAKKLDSSSGRRLTFIHGRSYRIVSVGDSAMFRACFCLVTFFLLEPTLHADNVEEFQKWTKTRSSQTSPSFFMEFTLKHTREALTLNSLKNMAAAPGKRVPSQRLEAKTSSNTLLVDGTNLRVDLQLPVLDHETEKLVIKRLVSTQNQSETRRAQLSNDKITSQNSSGLLMPSKSESLLDYNIFYPVLIGVRGDDPSLCLYPSLLFRVSTTAKTTKMNGKDCYELSIDRARTLDGTAITMWCCAAEQHLPVRIERTSQSGTREITNIENKKVPRPEGSYLPNEWVCDTFDKVGKLQKSYQIRVDKYDFVAKSTDGDFVLVYPPGIHVSDLKSGKQYLVDENHQLIEIAYDKNGNVVQVEKSGPNLFGIPLWPLVIGFVSGMMLTGLFWLVKRRSKNK